MWSKALNCIVTHLVQHDQITCFYTGHTHVHGESDDVLWQCSALQAPIVRTAVPVTCTIDIISIGEKTLNSIKSKLNEAQ